MDDQDAIPEPTIIDFSLDELAVLADLLEAPGIIGVDDSSLDAIEREVLAGMFAAASRSLLARGIVEPGDRDEELTITAPNAMILETLFSPKATVWVERFEQDRVETRIFYLAAGFSVIHWPDWMPIHRFALIDSVDALGTIAEFCSLQPRPQAEGEPIAVTEEALEGLSELSSADLDRAEKLLGQQSRFAEAVIAGGHRVHAVVLYADGAVVQGGETVWVDGRDAGLWQVEPAPAGRPGSPDDQVYVASPVTADALVDELISYLPAE